MINYNVLPDYRTRKEIIGKICEKYSFVKQFFIGKSVCGRCINVLHIGNTKHRVLYCGGFHGSEYLTAATAAWLCLLISPRPSLALAFR